MSRLLLLCYEKSGNALPVDEAPVRLVIPEEPRRVRWVRQVMEIQIKDAE